MSKSNKTKQAAAQPAKQPPKKDRPKLMKQAKLPAPVPDAKKSGNNKQTAGQPKMAAVPVAERTEEYWQERLLRRYHREQEDLVASEIMDSDGMTTIYNDSKQPIGIICSRMNRIDCIYVEPKHRRKGYGGRAIVRWFKKNHASWTVSVALFNGDKRANRFWNTLFVMRSITRNTLYTVYEVMGINDGILEKYGLQNMKEPEYDD